MELMAVITVVDTIQGEQHQQEQQPPSKGSDGYSGIVNDRLIYSDGKKVMMGRIIMWLVIVRDLISLVICMMRMDWGGCHLRSVLVCFGFCN